jgi:peptidyl-prolyl cis-trans isomerase B (cyclophilin B)
VPSDKRARQRAAREARLAAEAKNKKRRQQTRNGGIIVVVAGVIIGAVFLFSGSGTPKKAAVTTTTTTVAGETKADVKAQAAANALAVKAGCPANPATRVNTQTYKTAPAMALDESKLYSATIKTTAGTIVMALDAKAAPNTVNSFVFLAQKGYFNCVIFHRVVTGFVDQTGDPTGKGTGGPGYEFANENIPKAYAAGDVAMANSGANTNGSQFFFVVPGGQTTLDSDLASGGYSLFGTVASGMNVVEAINAQGSAAGTPLVTQRILSVTINEASGA